VQSVIVSNFSVFNCIGRMSTTFLPDRLWNRAMARTDFLVMGHVLSAACSLLAAHATINSLPMIAIFTGAPSPSATGRCLPVSRDVQPLL
jgi:hypothetical protein